MQPTCQQKILDVTYTVLHRNLQITKIYLRDNIYLLKITTVFYLVTKSKI